MRSTILIRKTRGAWMYKTDLNKANLKRNTFLLLLDEKQDRYAVALLTQVSCNLEIIAIEGSGLVCGNFNIYIHPVECFRLTEFICHK